MSYCSKKKQRYWKKMQQYWLDEIICKQFWRNLDKYNFKENKEWSIYDYEQSPLCQIIWGEILSEYFNSKLNAEEEKFIYLINRRELVVMNKHYRYRFLFDVMNNLKKCWTSDGKYYDYHFIGNFTPIPANNSKLPRSLQFKHRDFNENWTQMIKYIKENWGEFKMDSLTFEEYIEMTYQEDYCRKGIKEINSIKEIKNVIEKRGLKIQKKCEKLFKKNQKARNLIETEKQQK